MKSEDDAAAAGPFAGPGMRLEPIIGWNRGILDVAAGKKAEDRRVRLSSRSRR